MDGIGLSHIIADGTRESATGMEPYKPVPACRTCPSQAPAPDPHPGNYRITEDGKLAVLDCGAVSHLPDNPRQHWVNSFGSRCSGCQWRARGPTRRRFRQTQHRPRCAGIARLPDALVEPARYDTFHYTREWLRGEFMRMKDRAAGITIGFKLNLPPNYLLIHRVWLGSVGVLCQLDANVASRSKSSAGFRGS